MSRINSDVVIGIWDCQQMYQKPTKFLRKSIVKETQSLSPPKQTLWLFLNVP